jgi:hypothetical protein
VQRTPWERQADACLREVAAALPALAGRWLPESAMRDAQACDHPHYRTGALVLPATPARARRPVAARPGSAPRASLRSPSARRAPARARPPPPAALGGAPSAPNARGRPWQPPAYRTAATRAAEWHSGRERIYLDEKGSRLYCGIAGLAAAAAAGVSARSAAAPGSHEADRMAEAAAVLDTLAGCLRARGFEPAGGPPGRLTAPPAAGGCEEPIAQAIVAEVAVALRARAGPAGVCGGSASAAAPAPRDAAGARRDALAAAALARPGMYFHPDDQFPLLELETGGRHVDSGLSPSGRIVAAVALAAIWPAPSPQDPGEAGAVLRTLAAALTAEGCLRRRLPGPSPACAAAGQLACPACAADEGAAAAAAAGGPGTPARLDAPRAAVPSCAAAAGPPAPTRSPSPRHALAPSARPPRHTAAAAPPEAVVVGSRSSSVSSSSTATSASSASPAASTPSSQPPDASLPARGRLGGGHGRSQAGRPARARRSAASRACAATASAAQLAAPSGTAPIRSSTEPAVRRAAVLLPAARRGRAAASGPSPSSAPPRSARSQHISQPQPPGFSPASSSLGRSSSTSSDSPRLPLETPGASPPAGRRAATGRGVRSPITNNVSRSRQGRSLDRRVEVRPSATGGGSSRQCDEMRDEFAFGECRN